MKLNLSCRKFQKLWELRDERDLTPGEDAFVAKHKRDCSDCRAFAQSASQALSLLREAVLEPGVSAGFEERVIRRLHLQSRRESVSYWSPALVGGAIACIALVATLQIAASPVQLKRATLPAGEVRRMEPSNEPEPQLILKEKPLIDQ